MSRKHKGWICPRCEQSNAPWRETCDCTPATVRPLRYWPDWTWRPYPSYPWGPYTVCGSTVTTNTTHPISSGTVYIGNQETVT